MSQFKWKQIQSLRELFLQYYRTVPGLKNTSDYDIHKKYLDADGLCALLPSIGPPLSHEQTAKIVLRYDSSCTERLDFEDFLEFLADFESTLRQMNLLTSDIWNTPLLNGIQETKGFYVRKIRIHVRELRHLDRFMRATENRTNNQDSQLQFHAVLVIKIGNNIQEIVIDTVEESPDLNQYLDFKIELPKGSLNEAYKWMESQKIDFILYERIETGNVPSRKWISAVSFPLIQIFDAPIKKNLVFSRLHYVDVRAEPIELATTIWDVTSTKFSWFLFKDAQLSIADAWCWRQIEHLNVCLERDYGALREEAFLTDTTDKHLVVVDLARTLNQTFPRRPYMLAGFDEGNQPHLLNRFIQPLPSPKSTWTYLDIAHYVSLIRPAAAQTSSDDPAYLPFNHSYPVYFDAPIRSPSYILGTRQATVLEKAILLTNLFLGCDVQAFLALGSSHDHKQAWVVTIHPIDGTQKDHALFAFLNLYNRKVHFEPPSEMFDQAPLLAKVHELNSKNFVVHWDVTSGLPCLLSDFDEKFDRIYQLANHENIWLNIQKSTIMARPIFSWSLETVEHWLPFMKVPEVFDPIYSEPSMLYAFPLELSTDEMICQKLCSLIQGYRQHILFIPNTEFRNDVAQTLYDQFSSIQTEDVDYMYLIKLGKLPSLEDPKELVSSQTWVKQLEMSIIDMVQNNDTWIGRLFHLKTARLDLIFDLLVWSGVLDCSVTKSEFAVSMKITYYPADVVSVLLYVGYGYAAENE